MPVAEREAGGALPEEEGPMAILITVETVILALLTVLVAGLLRSHAEILRQLAELAGGAPAARTPDLALPAAREGSSPAFDIAGATVAGEPVKVAVAGARGNTLLAFLSSGCLPCHKLWHGLTDGHPRLPAGARLVIVTKDRSEESPTRLGELAPSGSTLIMSSAAWDAYGVKGSPYFIYVDGPTGEVHSEGTATTWDQVVSLLRDALADDELVRRQAARPGGLGRGRAADGSAERIHRADDELAAAGIVPGHPSLWQADGTADARPEDRT